MRGYKPKLVKKVSMEKLMDTPIIKLPDSPNKEWARYWHDTKNDVAFITNSVREHEDCEANININEITKDQYYHDFIQEEVDEDTKEMDDFLSLLNEPRKFSDY